MTDSQKAENRIEPGRLKIELDEPGFVPGTVLAPGEGTAKDPEVANTGTVPMLAYVTVSIPVKTVRLVDTDKVSVLPPAPTQLFTFENSDRWTLLDTREAEDGNVFSFGYLAVLEPGEVSDPVFEEIRLASVLEGELPEGTELLVRVEAIGLQAENICEQLPIRERVEYGYFNLIVPAAAEAAG